MKALFKLVITVAVIGFAVYLLGYADMTWDKNQKKIVPAAENTTEEEFDLNYKVTIEDLPKELVDKMKNNAVIHRAVAEALEENDFSKNEKVTFVNYTEDEHTGDITIHFVFGKNDNRLVYHCIKGTPVNYEMTIVTVEDIEE